MERAYWRKQKTDMSLFPDIDWQRPQQKSMRGKLGIIGGNKLGFISVAENFSTAVESGVGEVKILLPEVLKKSIPNSMTDVIFGSTNPSGGLASDAIVEMKALAEWANSILLIGDAGRNSETSILYESFIHDYKGQLVITRDAIDLIKNDSAFLVERPETLIVASFAQLQKIFQLIYYPVVLTFSMQLTNLVEALHKFTITYPACIVVLHKDTLIVASGGQVTSTSCDNPMKVWRGQIATTAAVYWLWSPTKTLESVTASLFTNK